MLYDLLQIKHIYIVCGKTDLRKGIDGLASLIQQEYQLDLYEDAVLEPISYRSLSRDFGSIIPWNRNVQLHFSCN